MMQLHKTVSPLEACSHFSQDQRNEQRTHRADLGQGIQKSSSLTQKGFAAQRVRRDYRQRSKNTRPKAKMGKKQAQTRTH